MKLLSKLMTCFCTVCLCTLIIGMKRPVFKSSGVNHLVNQINAPSDLYDPIIENTYPLWEKGRSATYPLNPKYHDIYIIGLKCDETNIPADFKFDGELLIEFLKDGQVVRSQTVSSFHSGTFADKEMEFYKEISLMRFEMPLDGKYWDELFLRITVLRADESLKKYEKGMRLYVSVSFIP